MDRLEIIKLVTDYVENSDENIISKELALSAEAAGTKMFEAPIFAFGAAEDEYFRALKEPTAIGKHFLLPSEWLPQAKTVISFFLPFSQAVKESNSRDMSWPSFEWMHGRIDGQALINSLTRYLQDKLQDAGYHTVVPCLDERYWARTEATPVQLQAEEAPVQYTSTWSERHVAHVCGMGTFGLTKGLITQKGTAGRLGSVVTELYLPPDQRQYQDLYEYCSRCGTCVKNCPVDAISLENGKIHPICSQFSKDVLSKHKPWYGCGKCQVKVPCESGIPKNL